MTTWTIGEAAGKCGLSQHTLRWYERIGLLSPIERGSDGRRRFTPLKLLDAKIGSYERSLT